MTTPLFPPLIEVETLETELHNPQLLIVDLGSASTYAQLHVPGAVHLDYAMLVANEPPVGGLMPPIDQLELALGAIGYGNDKHLVVYDDEGGGKAARLIFTLACLGLHNCSLLNGGLHAWANEGHPLSKTPHTQKMRRVRLAYLESNPCIADAELIKQRLEQGGVQLFDVRSEDEYLDRKRFSRRGGHIPGAVNLEWTEMMDRSRNLRLLPAETLHAMLHGLGLDPSKEVVTYCQTHHRSAYSFVVLKLLGFTQVRGYPGSWSDWGNRNDTPIEV